MTETTEQQTTEKTEPMTLSECLDRIQKMTEQRDKLKQAIVVHKKMAKKLVGKL